MEDAPQLTNQVYVHKTHFCKISLPLRRYSSEYDAHHLSLNTSSIGMPWSFPAR